MSEAELCPLEKKKWIHVLVCFVVTWGNLHRDMVHGSQVMYLMEEWPPTSPPQYWVILLLSCEVVDRDDLQNSELQKKKKLFMIYDFFWSVHVVLTWTEKWKQYFLNNSYRAECYVHLTFKQKYVLISFGYKEHEMSLCNLLYLKGWICWCILVVQQHFNNAIKTIFKAIQCHWNGTKWVEHISQFVINPAKRHYWCFSFFSHRALKVMWFS